MIGRCPYLRFNEKLIIMAKEIVMPECETDADIQEAIKLLACKSYKIGKTGLKVSERGGKPDYADDYDYIRCLFSSTSATLISDLESRFINEFIDDPKNDNIKDGEQSEHDNMAEDADKYSLYVVWKKKSVTFRKN